MPTYNYTCKKDHMHTEFRSMSERSSSTKCPTCGSIAHQTLSTPALHTFTGDKFAREHEVEGNGIRSHV
mgnify:CR=1 FL=1